MQLWKFRLSQRVEICTVLSAIVAIVFYLFVAWYYDAGHEPVEKVVGLPGRDVEYVVRRFGKPIRELSFKIGEGIDGEMRLELLRHYPLSRESNRSVQIRELHWKETRCDIIVWMHQVDGRWVVLDAIRVQQGVKF